MFALDSELSYQTAVALALSLVCVGIAIDSFEYLRIIPQFSDGGVFAWKVYRTRSRTPKFQILRTAREWLFDYKGVRFLLVLRLGFLALLLAPGQSEIYYFVCVLLIFALGLLLDYRCVFGGDGAGQMQTVVLAGIMVSLLLPSHSALKTIGIWFIVAQSCLSYLASGISKLASQAWRSGEAAFKIFNTSTYGSRSMATLLKDYPILQKAVCWSVIAFECAFPICLFLPQRYALGMLGIGVLFHIGNAIFMGLNTFFWAFIATYPAVLLCNHKLALWYGQLMR